LAAFAEDFDTASTDEKNLVGFPAAARLTAVLASLESSLLVEIVEGNVEPRMHRK
jgi:hypothetical protein